MEKYFRPKLIDTLKRYTSKQNINDLFAGIIVGIVALPLAIAFAIASGVTPEKGLNMFLFKIQCQRKNIFSF